MTSIKSIIATVAVSIALSFAAQAEDAKTLKPMQGTSFHAGTKHAVAYFLTDKSTCKLVLTLADDGNYAPTRFEEAVEAHKSTLHQIDSAKALQFVCHADAQAMTINMLETVAAVR